MANELLKETFRFGHYKDERFVGEVEYTDFTNYFPFTDDEGFITKVNNDLGYNSWTWGTYPDEILNSLYEENYEKACYFTVISGSWTLDNWDKPYFRDRHPMELITHKEIIDERELTLYTDLVACLANIDLRYQDIHLLVLDDKKRLLAQILIKGSAWYSCPVYLGTLRTLDYLLSDSKYSQYTKLVSTVKFMYKKFNMEFSLIWTEEDDDLERPEIIDIIKLARKCKAKDENIISGTYFILTNDGYVISMIEDTKAIIKLEYSTPRD